MHTRTPLNLRVLSFVLLLAAVGIGLISGIGFLPGLHASAPPYYPYQCPLISGGRSFNGLGTEPTAFGVPHWNPVNGLWFKSLGTPDEAWGTYGDIPTPGDYNGDGTDDLAVFRPSNGTWYIKCSSLTNCPAGSFSFQFGAAGDIPVPGDYHNDGFTDYAVWRPSTGVWYLTPNGPPSGTAYPFALPWGQYGDCPIPGRVGSGVGTTLRLNVFRPSNGVWYVGQHHDGTLPGLAFAFGTYGDLPFVAEIDDVGDGNIVVFRPSTGTWYGRAPAAFAIGWGQPGDIPVIRGRRSGQSAALTVYRPTTALTHSCLNPSGGSCTGGTATNGPSGSPGVVPLSGFTR